MFSLDNRANGKQICWVFVPYRKRIYAENVKICCTPVVLLDMCVHVCTVTHDRYARSLSNPLK